MSFASGMQMGLAAKRDQAEMARQAEMDARSKQMHDMQLAEMQRRARLDASDDEAQTQFMREYNGVGVPPAAGAPIAPAAPPANMPAGGIPVPRAPSATMPDAPPTGGAPVAPMPEGPKAPAQGAGMPAGDGSPFANRRAKLAAQRRYLSSLSGGRGMQGLIALDREEQALKREEALAGVPERLKDPEFRGKLNGFINETADYVTLLDEKVDKNGRKTWNASVVQPGGQSKTVKLSEAQYAQLGMGVALIEMGDAVDGMKMIREANAEIADGLERQNRTQMGAAKFNAGERDSADDATYRQGLLTNDTRKTNAMVASAGARGVPEPKAPGPQFKYVKDDSGGFYTDPNGMAVARHDPERGMVPFGPDPMSDPQVARTAMQFGIRALPGSVGGRVVWGFVTPDGQVYDSLEEAATQVQARGIAQNARSTPSTEAARRGRQAVQPGADPYQDWQRAGRPLQGP